MYRFIFCFKIFKWQEFTWREFSCLKETCRDGIVEFYKTCNELSLTNYKIVNSNDKYFISIKSSEDYILQVHKVIKVKRSVNDPLTQLKQTSIGLK